MSCCNNTYNLGCYDSCSNLSIGITEVSGTYKGIFTSGNNRITQTITVISGQPFVFDLRKLNESATYSLSIYRNGVQQEITIDDVQYDCFSFKTQILGLDNSVTPIQGCTPFCQEIGIITDDTLSGKGTDLSPLTVVGGGGGSSVWGGITGTLSNQIDLQNALNAKQNLITTGTTAQYLRGDLSLATFPTNLSQFTNDVGFITNVITSLGYTPESVANKQTDLTSSATKYPTVNAVNTGLALKVTANSAITGATKTKITYDSKGLVTGGVDASLSELLDDATHRTVTDAQIAAWNALIGGSVFQTVWNATTNSPSLVSSVGTKGFYYIVNVSGSTNLNGITDWKVGDWAIFDGTVWRKVDNTDAVSDVNGLTGSVVLDTSNVSATLNKRYVTDAQLVIIGNTSGTNSGDNSVNSLYSGLATSKQDTLVSGTNIKTINGTSLLGSGNIAVGASLSGLTAATSTNTIDNLNFQQNWNFSTLDTTIGLKIATAAAQTTSATQVLVQFRKTNTTTGVKASAVLEVINEDANVSSTSVGARFEGRNYACIFGGSLFATPNGANIGIVGSGEIRFGVSSSNYNYYGGKILEVGGDLSLIPSSGRRVSIWTGSLNTTDFLTTTGANAYVSLEYDSTNINRIVLGGNRYGYRSTYGAAIQQTSGVLSLGAFLVSGGIKYQLSISDANNNVGIGTTTPHASAKLELSSTTQGFRLTPMTSTQASAITVAEGLMLFTSDTNGTFTSIGLWCYENGAWSKK